MQFTRRQGNITETIDDHYGELLQSPNDVQRVFGQTMLDLIGLRQRGMVVDTVTIPRQSRGLSRL
jgi:hypothetical protein